MIMSEHIEILSKREIENTVKNLAASLHWKIKMDNIVVIGILNGSVLFFSDLLRLLPSSCKIDFMRVSSYINNKSTKLVWKMKWQEDLKGKTVLLVDDIVDSGKTVKAVIKEMKKEKPKEIIVISLLVRKGSEKFVDCYGLIVRKDIYVYGYGLDDNGKMRGLNKIMGIIN